MSAQEKSDRFDAAARLDGLPFTRLHAAIMLVCALGLVFDVAELGLSNALSAVFSAPPHQVSSSELSFLLASVFAGGAIGAPILGWLSDRHGRQTILSFTLAGLAVASLCAAASPNVTGLTFFRCLSGIALGAYPPLIVAYLSGIGFLGGPAVIFLIRWLTPLSPLGIEGWRWALILGGAGSALVALLFRALPESPRWLLATGRATEAEATSRRFENAAKLGSAARPAASAPTPVDEKSRDDDFWSPAGSRHRKRAALIAALYLLSPWATIGFPLLSGAVLIQKGFRVSDSLLYVGISLFGPTLGSFAASLGIDRLERRTAIVLCAAIMAVAALAFGITDIPAVILAAGIVFNLVGAVYVSTASVYTAELFPTRLRASITSSAWAVNRVSSMLMPFVLLQLLTIEGPVVMLAVVAAILVVIVAMILAFGPRGLTGQPVT